MQIRQLLWALSLTLTTYCAVQLPFKTLEEFTDPTDGPLNYIDNCLRIILQCHPQLNDYKVNLGRKIPSKVENVTYCQVRLRSKTRQVQSVVGYENGSDSFFVSFDVIKDRKMRISHKRIPYLPPTTLERIPVPPLFRIKNRFVTAEKLRQYAQNISSSTNENKTNGQTNVLLEEEIQPKIDSYSEEEAIAVRESTEGKVEAETIPAQDEYFVQNLYAPVELPPMNMGYSILGGKSEVDLENNTDFRFQLALDYLEKQHPYLKCFNKVSAESMVVAGVTYYIDYEGHDNYTTVSAKVNVDFSLEVTLLEFGVDCLQEGECDNSTALLLFNAIERQIKNDQLQGYALTELNVLMYQLEESIFEALFDNTELGYRALLEVQIFDGQSQITAFFTFPIVPE